MNGHHILAGKIGILLKNYRNQRNGKCPNLLCEHYTNKVYIKNIQKQVLHLTTFSLQKFCNQLLLLFVVSLSLIGQPVFSKPDGAPREACRDLRPQHPGVAQEVLPHMFQISFYKSESEDLRNVSRYSPGENYTGLCK